jgi:hypothetical protein
MRRLLPWIALVAPLVACGAPGDDGSSAGEDPVKIDTSSASARAQYAANVAFATRYRARCEKSSDRPRVLVTGFGRVFGSSINASGMLVSALVPAARYPMTRAPEGGKIDDPAPQLSVGQTTVELPLSGDVDLCGMVLPASWDLTAVLVSKEIESFSPDFVMMNGIARDRQPIWIELGNINRALPDEDAVDLKPSVPRGETYAPLVKSEPVDRERPLLSSYARVRAAAEDAIADEKKEPGGDALSEILRGVGYPKYPRPSGNYLCNNLAYVTSWLMTHPGESLDLMEASAPERGAPSSVPVRLTRDHSRTPRVFVHWPSGLADHVAQGARVMSRMIDAQLDALRGGEVPTPGDKSMADIDPTAF